MDPQDTSDLHLLEVNFDPALINLLRETKYFLSLGIDVPEEARGVFDRSKTFRRHIGSLELIVAVWNRIQKTILPVELPLVKLQIEELWTRLDDGLRNLDWNSPTIDKYLDDVKVSTLKRKIIETVLVFSFTVSGIVTPAMRCSLMQFVLITCLRQTRVVRLQFFGFLLCLFLHKCSSASIQW